MSADASGPNESPMAQYTTMNVSILGVQGHAAAPITGRQAGRQVILHALSTACLQLFETYRQIYDFGRTFSYEEYSSKQKTMREIRRDMHRQREWRNELERMKISSVRRMHACMRRPAWHIYADGAKV